MPHHRAALPDGFFHVTARSIGEQALFADDDDRQVFVNLAWRAAALHGLVFHVVCVMSTHYHAVVEATVADLSRGFLRLNSHYAVLFNRRHGRFGSLFSERFAARVIDSEEYLYDACGYVLENPVKAGLCDRIQDWPWSFCRYPLDAF
jgi:REP element-mobilizing transposase RayT